MPKMLSRTLMRPLLESSQSGFRELFRAPNGDAVLCESSEQYKWWEQFTGALSGHHVKPEDFSIQGIFEAVIENGRSIYEAWRRGESVSLVEAAGAVSASHFSNITGQIVYSKMLDAFQNPEFVFTKLIPNTPTQFNGEKIPGITSIGDRAEVVGEGQPFPIAGVGEDWIETPQTVKRGLIVPVTKEAVFFDRTGMVLQRAGEVGEFLGLNKEKRAIDCVIDENTTAHRYRWRGTTIATYGNNSGTHTWDNLQASNALVDWTDINGAELLLAAMLDPNTGEPMTVMADTLIVCPELMHTARYVLNATAVALQAGGFATSGNLWNTQAVNPIGSGSPFSGSYNIVTSRLLPTRLATDTHWFLGNPKKAFAYMENWGLTSVTAPPNNLEEFTRDIVAQYKASERGAFATLEPRCMVQNTVA